jgi:hypothetical protein
MEKEAPSEEASSTEQAVPTSSLDVLPNEILQQIFVRYSNYNSE